MLPVYTLISFQVSESTVVTALEFKEHCSSLREGIGNSLAAARDGRPPLEPEEDERRIRRRISIGISTHESSQ